jgi:hypothetical protein
MMDHLSMHVAVRSASDSELRYFLGYLDQKVRAAPQEGDDSGAELDRYESRRLEVEGEIERRRPERHRPHEPPKGTTFFEMQRVGIELESQGRFAGMKPEMGPRYPKLPDGSPWAHQEPVEPPLGYSIEDQPPTGEPFEIDASRTAAPAHPSPGVAVEASALAPAETLSAVFPQHRDEPGQSTIKRFRRIR